MTNSLIKGRRVKLGIALACAGWLCSANANVAGSNPDADSNFNGSTFTSVINFAENEIISDLSVSVNIAHTNVGDLVATLSHDGNSVTLLSTFSDNSNLGATGPRVPPIDERTYTFSDSASTTIATQAGSIGDTEFVPPGTLYLAAAGDFGNAFGGANTMGDWTLSIEDITSGGGQSSRGKIDGWSINITSAVPEPMPLAFLAAGGLMLYARRRRASKVR